MLNKLIKYTLCFSLVILFFACKEETYNGDKLINYPDLNQILQNEWDMDSTVVYWKVSKNKSTTDSLQLSADAMPWDEIKEAFNKANIQRKELNLHYAIDIMNDSMSNTMTLFYKTLAPKDYTRSISIVSSTESNEMSSLYFETLDKGVTQKVLFAPYRFLQMQNIEREEHSVVTYYFTE